MPLHLYPDLQSSGKLPPGWKPLPGAAVKFPVRDSSVRRYLRSLKPGRWKKVIKYGTTAEVHYFEHASGWVAGVKVR